MPARYHSKSGNDGDFRVMPDTPVIHRPRRLSARFVATVQEPGRYGDGHGSGGLTLLVRRSSRGRLTKSWAQRLLMDGRLRSLGLGAWPHVSLAEARRKCASNLVDRDRGQLVTVPKRAVPTFEEAAETVIAIHATGWKHGSASEADWWWSLRKYAMPKLAQKPVNRITTADVMAILIPIWNPKRVTARKVRQRIGAVMRWAVAHGYRQDNPAGEAIGAALPRQRIRPRHFAALPYGKVAEAIAAARASGAPPLTVLAFEFLVLTASRSAEVRGALWKEINLAEREWRIPAGRMKTNREHRVPLSGRAVEVLGEARNWATRSELVFPSRTRRPLDRAAISRLVRQLGIGAVPHGFRSSFRDWAAERTDSPREVCELALAHVNTNAIEAAYRRTDLFERRRVLMEQWAAFLTGTAVS